jgi:hypothetical protein
MFVSDNDDDGLDQTRICYVMPGGNYGYHPRGKGQTHWHEEQPGVVPKLLRTYRGSPTGMCVYEGWLLPEKYQGQLLHTDAGPAQLRCYHLKDKGASYSIEREDMVVSSDSWFRPSDVCVAPDGAAFVADWYDPGVGGHNIRDFNAGRIYRVAPKGNKPTVPAVDLKTSEGIVIALRSPNLAVRHMAMAKLERMDKGEALKVLTPAVTQKQDPVLRARALWQLARIPNLKFVAQAFSDPDPRFRILAMRIFSDFVGQSPAEYIPDMREALVNDPSPAVRREALLLLREEDPARAKPLILELARRWDGQDRFYLAAIGIAVSQDSKRREAIIGDFEQYFSEWDGKLIGLLWELRPPQMVPLLTKKLADPKLPQIVEVLAGSADMGIPLTLVKSLAQEKSPLVRDKIVETLKANLSDKWIGLRKSPELKKLAAQWLADPATTVLALELAAIARIEELAEAAGKIANNPKLTLPARLAAVKALGRLTEGVIPLIDVVARFGHGPGDPSGGGRRAFRQQKRQHLVDRGAQAKKAGRRSETGPGAAAAQQSISRREKTGRGGIPAATAARSQEAAEHHCPFDKKRQHRPRRASHGQEPQKRCSMSQMPHHQWHRRPGWSRPVDHRQQGQPRKLAGIDPLSQPGDCRPVSAIRDRNQEGPSSQRLDY